MCAQLQSINVHLWLLEAAVEFMWVGWWGGGMGWYLQSSLCPTSNNSWGPVIVELGLWQCFLDPIFWTQSFLDQKFVWSPDCFDPKFLWNQNFFGSKIVWAKKLFLLKKIWNPNLFYQKLYYDPTFFLTILVDLRVILDPCFFWPKIIFVKTQL